MLEAKEAVEAITGSSSLDIRRLERKFTLDLLEHVNVLRDAVHLSIVGWHVGQEFDKFAGVKAAVCVEVFKEALMEV